MHTSATFLENPEIIFSISSACLSLIKSISSRSTFDNGPSLEIANFFIEFDIAFSGVFVGLD